MLKARAKHSGVNGRVPTLNDLELFVENGEEKISKCRNQVFCHSTPRLLTTRGFATV